MKKVIPINTLANGLCPAITARYAQGFAFSSAVKKSSYFIDGNPECGSRDNVRLAILEIYGEDNNG